MSETQDRREIIAVLHRYAELLDSGQVGRILSEVFTSDVVEDHGAGLEPTSGVKDLRVWLRDALAPFAATMHALSNITVEFDGDRATSRAYYQAYHWLIDSPTDDDAVDWLSVGAYIDEWRHTPEGWRISHRRRRNIGPGSDVIGRRPTHLTGGSPSDT